MIPIPRVLARLARGGPLLRMQSVNAPDAREWGCTPVLPIAEQGKVIFTASHEDDKTVGIVSREKVEVRFSCFKIVNHPYST